MYALCKIDDISWGTKGLDSDNSLDNRNMGEEWRKIKIMHVCKFILYNFLVGFILVAGEANCQLRFWFPCVIIVILAFTLVIRIVFGVIYIMFYKCCFSGGDIQKNEVDFSDFKDEIDDIF